MNKVALLVALATGMIASTAAVPMGTADSAAAKISKNSVAENQLSSAALSRPFEIVPLRPI